MANIGNFNPAAQEPLGAFIEIPKGEWNAHIADSRIEQGASAENSKLVIVFDIDEGSAKGGKIEENIFLWSAEKKGDIGRRKMTSITNAVGIFQEFQDTAVLHGRPLTLRTDCRFVAKTDGSGFMSFPDVKQFLPHVGPGRAAGADPVQPQAPAQAAVPATAPRMAPQVAPPSSAPVAAPAPAMMPQGFQMPGQQTAPPQAPGGFAPPMGAPGFMPPQAPVQGFTPPMPGAPAAWTQPR